MNWLARLKKIETGTETDATKTTKSVSVVFVAPISAPMQKNEGAAEAANDQAPDADRWCWPHTQAMNTAEIDTFTGRLATFTDRGLTMADAETLADWLVVRDRARDDRRTCLECPHLRGAGRWRCGNGLEAGMAIRAGDVPLPADLVQRLQRCEGFNGTGGGSKGCGASGLDRISTHLDNKTHIQKESKWQV